MGNDALAFNWENWHHGVYVVPAWTCYLSLKFEKGSVYGYTGWAPAHGCTYCGRRSLSEPEAPGLASNQEIQDCVKDPNTDTEKECGAMVDKILQYEASQTENWVKLSDNDVDVKNGMESAVGGNDHYGDCSREDLSMGCRSAVQMFYGSEHHVCRCSGSQEVTEEAEVGGVDSHYGACSPGLLNQGCEDNMVSFYDAQIPMCQCPYVESDTMNSETMNAVNSETMNAIVVHDVENSSLLINGLAAFGLVVMLYGAFRHYTKSE